MDKELFDFVAERADILANADSSKQATKDAALDWKEAVEADPACADAETAKLVDFLEGRPNTIEGVIAFLEGPAKEILGEEAAAAGLAAQLERKEATAPPAPPRPRSSPSSAASSCSAKRRTPLFPRGARTRSGRLGLKKGAVAFSYRRNREKRLSPFTL